MTHNSQLAAEIAQLATATQTLKQLLAADRSPTLCIESCHQIAATAAAITAIGPIEPKPQGLYAAWLEAVLTLGAAKTKDFAAAPLEALDNAIAAVRLMRRTFGIAPGGA